MGARRAGTGRRGFGLVEILVVLAVLALAGVLLVRYVGSTQKTVETFQRDRPLANARLMADRATLETLAGLVRNYQAQKGQWPLDRAAVLALLVSAPKFQCAGNDFEYDAATGALRLLVTDAARC
jgi:prepilin-type N-terminal cleavage/methylation domain-containing protein